MLRKQVVGVEKSIQNPSAANKVQCTFELFHWRCLDFE